MGIKPTKMLTKAQATDLGKKLEVDLVIYGSLPVYDEHEGTREIQESRGGGFTENIREITVEYDFYLIRISDGTLIKNIKKSAKERDTAKDPMMPAPPDKQLRRATRSMTKKLVKQFIKE
ncbi:hypothetical protein K8T06_05915 [bacterium]|nr:hypothetical protein [bacterium]